MKATLYDKTGKIKIGDLDFILDENKSVEEERNGIFELIFNYPNGYPLADQLIEENIIEVKPNDDQLPQKFRIYNTKKILSNIITVFSRHESFDLANDHVENITLENASCEYALNTLFRNSHFSKDFRGYSDIVNAQDYKVDNVNILNAIAGKEGSIIDTYGTGAEILRDGKNIHVLNKRGHDNGVTIEYGKNLTGFELNVDLTGLETRCGGFAKYKPSNSDEEIVIKSDWIDSPFIDNFSHPYISTQGRRDYSDKFKDGVIPTKEALNKLCQDEFKINKRDIPASNYKINFIPLSKCVGYEGIEDKISLCDTVTIIDPRFNINTKAKVIKYKYDFIKERYISMELGEPRTTLGDIIGNGGKGEQGPPGPPGKDGADGNIGDFPNSLPAIPILTAIVKGFASIDLSWTYEDKVYYTYEVYASKTKDFTPNTFDLIHEGQTSSFLFQAKPNETWYFRVCAKNTHGDRTDFSPQVIATTNKADNFDEYFSSLAVGSLVTNIFSADYMEAGIVKGHWIDAKNLSVTDGNGKRTLDIDSFGNVNLDVHTLKIKAKEVGTKEDINNAINLAEDNMLANSNFLKYNGKINGWSAWSNNENTNIMLNNYIFSNGEGVGLYNPIKLNSVLEFHSNYIKAGGFNELAISFDVFREESVANAKVILRQVDDQFRIIIDSEFSIPELYDGRLSNVFEITDDRVKWVKFILHHGGTWQNTSEAAALYFNRVMISKGGKFIPWKASSLDQLTNRYSKIESDMNQINLEVGAKVNATDVISAINLSPEKVKIQSNNIDIAGATTVGSAHDGRYVKIENETFRVMNGDTPCMHLGYRTWQGYTGVPEFLMGYNGFVYSDHAGAPYSGTYFGMSTFGNEKNPEGTKPYHSIYYRSRTRADETQINFYEDGRTKIKSMGEFSLIADGGTWLQANNGGLVFNNGFQSYSDGRIDGNMVLNKNILMNGQIYTKDLKQGFGIEKYEGVDAFMLRKMTINPMDLGYDTAESRFRNIYAENGVINTSDERLKTNIVPITNKIFRRKRSLSSDEYLSTNDFHEFIKKLQFYRYDYKSGNGDASSHNVGFVANEVAETKVGKEFIFKDKDDFYQYNLQGYVGVIGVALQEEINKNEFQSKRIDELEKLVYALVDEIKTLKEGV